MDGDTVDLAEVARLGIDGNWLEEEHAGRLPATEENLAEARSFLVERWAERATERGLPPPVDLSSACKFGTLFVKAVFGGAIKGHYDHLHNVIDGQIVDLQADAADVRVLADPYRVDEDFLWDEDLADSLMTRPRHVMTCLGRVETWSQGFLSRMGCDAPRP